MSGYPYDEYDDYDQEQQDWYAQPSRSEYGAKKRGRPSKAPKPPAQEEVVVKKRGRPAKAARKPVEEELGAMTLQELAAPKVVKKRGRPRKPVEEELEEKLPPPLPEYFAPPPPPPEEEEEELIEEDPEKEARRQECIRKGIPYRWYSKQNKDLGKCRYAPRNIYLPVESRAAFARGALAEDPERNCRGRNVSGEPKVWEWYPNQKKCRRILRYKPRLNVALAPPAIPASYYYY